jgi:hypothetical protein
MKFAQSSITTHTFLQMYCEYFRYEVTWGSGTVLSAVMHPCVQTQWYCPVIVSNLQITGAKPRSQSGGRLQPNLNEVTLDHYYQHLNMLKRHSTSGRCGGEYVTSVSLHMSAFCINNCSWHLRGCIQKFPDWVYSGIYAYNNKHSLRSNIKGYGGKTH